MAKKDAQDKAFEEARENPFTDEDLAKFLEDGSAQVTQGEYRAPEEFEGWDAGRTSPDDHGKEDAE